MPSLSAFAVRNAEDKAGPEKHVALEAKLASVCIGNYWPRRGDENAPHGDVRRGRVRASRCRESVRGCNLRCGCALHARRQHERCRGRGCLTGHHGATEARGDVEVTLKRR